MIYLFLFNYFLEARPKVCKNFISIWRQKKKFFSYLLTFKAEAKPVPKVYQLEDLIVNIQRSLKASLKDFSSKDQERVKRFLTHFNSPTSVSYKFETAYFDEIPSCPFHEGNLFGCIVIYSGAAQSICGTSPLEGPGQQLQQHFFSTQKHKRGYQKSCPW